MPINKVTSHLSQNEQLIFERSHTGRIGYRLPALDVDEVELNIPTEFRRDDDLEGMPEVSEVDVIRHFVRMSTWNYSIDLGMYPLGSCTMKYNSRLNEKVARIAGFANLHPLTEEHDAQGALQVIYELQQHLAEITGLPGISLQPAAGAHGDMTGIMIMRAFLDARDGAAASHRRTMLIPDSAHGTNPASAHLSGFSVKTILNCGRSDGSRSPARTLRPRRSRGFDVDQSKHARPLRNQHPTDLRHRSRSGRPRLDGRPKHERARRRRAPGRHGRRCDPSQPAQDFLNSAWRRWTGLWSMLLHERARTVSAGAADRKVF